MDLVAFGKQAELINDILDKGTFVEVEAEYSKNRQTDAEGNTRTFHNFIVRSFYIMVGSNRSNGDETYEEGEPVAEYDDGDMPF